MNLWINRDWSPMLLKETDMPFDSKDYIFEVKFDGIRACIFVGPNEFKIMNRHKVDITFMYPELKEIQQLVRYNTILDGEIIAIKDNAPSFSKLQERSHLKDKNKIWIQSISNPVLFVAFDILYQEKDLTNLTILKRKRILDKIKDNDCFIKSKVFKDNGIKLFENVKIKNLEGIVAKEINSTYQINTRSNNWIKIKNSREEEFIIGGYEEKNNGNLSLLLGELINNKLYYVGSVRTTKNLEFYKNTLKVKKITKSPFYNYERLNATYIFPKIKCLVKYMERTKSNHLRQPVIKKYL